MSSGFRVFWIDISKGILIALIVLGHIISDNRNILQTWIYSFHVPAFFLINGLLKRRFLFVEKNTLTSVIIKEKYLSIMYIMFSLIFLIRFVIQLFFGMYDIHDLKIFVLHSLFLNGEGVLWYIPVFVLAEIVFFLSISNGKRGAVVFLFCFAVGIFAYHYFAFNNVLYEERILSLIIILYIKVIIAASLMMIGYYLEYLRIFDSKLIYLLGTLSFLSIMNGNIDINNLRLNNIILFYLFSISGVLLTVAVSKLIEKYTKTIGYILASWGENSIVIMLTHAIFLIYQICGMVFKYMNVATSVSIIFTFIATMFIEMIIIRMIKHNRFLSRIIFGN